VRRFLTCLLELLCFHARESAHLLATVSVLSRRGTTEYPRIADALTQHGAVLISSCCTYSRSLTLVAATPQPRRRRPRIFRREGSKRNGSGGGPG
jgi:hypothetical protein